MIDDRWNKLVLFIITVLFLIPLACNLPSTAPPSTPTSGINPTPLDHGPSPTPEPTLTPRPTGSGEGKTGCTYRAELVSSSLAYGARLRPGATFTQAWTLKNTGTCAWDKVSLQFVGGSRFGAGNQARPVPKAAAGNTTQISLNLQAPQQAGPYRGEWQLVNEQGHAFGPQVLPIVAQVHSSGGAANSGGSGSGKTEDGKKGGVSLPDIGLSALDRLGIGPDLGKLPLYIRHPALAWQLEMNDMPDLGDNVSDPLERYYINHPPIDTLVDAGLIKVDGQSEESEAGTSPDNPDQNLVVHISGAIKVREYTFIKDVNQGKLDFVSKEIVLSEDKPTGRFEVQYCESGKDNKGEQATVIIGVHRRNGGEAWLGVHHNLTPQINCRTGKSTDILPPYSYGAEATNEFLIKLTPGEQKDITKPWLQSPGDASSKLQLSVSVEPVE